MNYGESKPGGPYLGMSHARQVLAQRLQRFLDRYDVSCECKHERLPGDPSPVCGCWPLEQEGAGLIPIPSAGVHAVVDAEDAARLARFRWHLSHGYVSRHDEGGGHVSLHREVMGCEKGDGTIVDHRNGDRRDNRKTNLRIVSRSGNNANRRGADRDARSPYRGVSPGPPHADGTPTWRAHAVISRKQHYLGTFGTEREAAEAAADFRRRHMPTSEMDGRRPIPQQRLCECGCGTPSKSRFIVGHNRRGRTIRCDGCNRFVSTPGLCSSCSQEYAQERLDLEAA